MLQSGYDCGLVGGAGRRVVTYLDTGCFVKLYYPEPDSAKVVVLIQGKSLCHTPLHALEFVNVLRSAIQDITSSARFFQDVVGDRTCWKFTNLLRMVESAL